MEVYILAFFRDSAAEQVPQPLKKFVYDIAKVFEPTWPTVLLVQKIAPLFKDGPAHEDTCDGNRIATQTSKMADGCASASKADACPVKRTDEPCADRRVKRRKAPPTVSKTIAEERAAGNEPCDAAVSKKSQQDERAAGKEPSHARSHVRRKGPSAVSKKSRQDERPRGNEPSDARSHVRRKGPSAVSKKSQQDSKLADTAMRKIALPITTRSFTGETSRPSTSVVDGRQQEEPSRPGDDGQADYDSEVEVVYVSDGREKVIVISSDSEDWDL